jgi:ABC-2 type transport system ATP-binding protein
MIIGHQLSKSYQHGFPALDAVSFTFEQSRMIGIIGHNGAGKTTLLKIIAGLITPDSGELHINGIDIIRNPQAVKGSIGYLPEESRLYETMTVEEYLRFFGEIYHLDRKTIRERAGNLLNSLALDPEKKKIGELSKGMRRKVAIARSLIHNPDLLIYDEPTSGLDPMTSRFIGEYLRQLRADGKTILLSAHNLYQVEALCDKVMILWRGKVVAWGSMPELRELFGSIQYTILFSSENIQTISETVQYTPVDGLYQALTGDPVEMNRIIQVISGAGGKIERIESHYPSLEEMLVKIGR